MSEIKKQDNGFTAISVSKEDYAFYDQIRQELTVDKGVKISIAQTIKLGMTFYNQRRKLGMDEIKSREDA